MIRIGLWALAAVALVGVGVLAAALILPPPPASLDPGRAPTTVPVSISPFTDDRAVEVVGTFAPDRTLRSPASGRVTATSCRIGMPIHSGGSMVSVDGAPLLNLATGIPLWRDIGAGSKGPDVSALQTELQQLGHPVEVDGEAGRATLAAVKALLTSIGASVDGDGLPLGAVLWLPASLVVPSACDAAPGDQIGPGDVVAQLPAGLDAIVVKSVPAGTMPGGRVMVIGPVRLALADDGVTVEPTELQREDVLVAIGLPESGSTVTRQATLSLIEPVDVAVVPPASIVTDGGRSCVLVGGRPEPINIVGSQLGETFVVFEGDPPAEIDARPGGDLGCR